MDEQIVTDQNIEKFAAKLGDENIFNQVSFVVDFITESAQSGESYRFLTKLQQLVSKAGLSGDMKRRYESLIVRLKFVALPLLETEEVAELFKTNLVLGVKSGVDLRNRVHFLFFPTDVTTADLSKKNLLVKAIEENNQIIGNVNLQVGNKDLAPTVGNWVLLYKQLSIEGEKSTFDVVRFLTENKFVARLDNNSKDLLKELLKFYNWLRFEAIDLSSVLKSTQPQNTKSLPIQSVSRSTSTPKSNAATPPAAPGSKQQSNFDAKLAAVSAPVSSHGQDLSSLRKKLEENKVSLAPKAQSAAVKMTPAEIKREVNTPELPTHMQPVVKPAPAPEPVLRPAPKVEKPRPAIKRNYGPMAIRSLNDIHVIEDLKKVEPGHLRQGPVNAQLQIIKTKIITLAKADNVLPYYAVSAFEQSPLFLTYLDKGSAQVSGDADSADLSQEEFEAMADLRKEIERL